MRGFKKRPQNERAQRIAQFDPEVFGLLLAKTHEIAMRHAGPRGFKDLDDELPALPCLYLGTLETPLRYAPHPVMLPLSSRIHRAARRKNFVQTETCDRGERS